MVEAEWHTEKLAVALDGPDDLHEKACLGFLERLKYWSAASAFL